MTGRKVSKVFQKSKSKLEKNNNLKNGGVFLLFSTSCFISGMHHMVVLTRILHVSWRILSYLQILWVFLFSFLPYFLAINLLNQTSLAINGILNPDDRTGGCEAKKTVKVLKIKNKTCDFQIWLSSYFHLRLETCKHLLVTTWELSYAVFGIWWMSQKKVVGGVVMWLFQSHIHTIQLSTFPEANVFPNQLLPRKPTIFLKFPPRRPSILNSTSLSFQ